MSRAWASVVMPLPPRRVEQRRLHLIGRAADVEVDGERRFEQPFEMLVDEGPAPVVEAQPLPHAVAQHEARVVDADHRLALRLQRDPFTQIRMSSFRASSSACMRADVMPSRSLPGATLSGRRGLKQLSPSRDITCG
jgi:hypothetical protein